jgi:hypothetical protein
MPDNLPKTFLTELLRIGRARISRMDGEDGEWLSMALDAFEENEDLFLGMGEDAVKELMGLIKDGKDDEAKRFFITNAATAEDLIKGMKDSAEEIGEATDWDEVWESISEVFTQMVAGIVLHLMDR